MTTDWMQLNSIALNEGTDPPAELWPAGTSDEYAAARMQLLEEQRALRDRIREAGAGTSRLPAGAVMPEYRFAEGPPDLEADEPVTNPTLLDLFGDADQLFVYHMMFHPDDDQACPMCSMWVDGLYGVSHHIRTFGSFVVIGRAPLPKLRRWAGRRGWDRLRIASSYQNDFNADMHIEGERGGQWPGVSTFRRDGDEVRHVITQIAQLPGDANGGLDLLSPIWHVLDLMPSGRGDWLADNDYPGRARG